jgi:hypothetical protein
MFRPGISLCAIDDGCEGTGDNHTFNGWCVCFDGFEDPYGAVDSGIQKVFLRVRDVEVEGGSSVDYSFEPINLQCIVKSSLDGNIWDDLEGEFGGRGV